MNRMICLLDAVMVTIGYSVTAAVLPAPPPAGAHLFPEFVAVTNTTAAQAVFRPMSGSVPVSLEGEQGSTLVRLPVNFSGTDHDRASWDVRMAADLAVARGIQFDFFCSDSSSVSYFSVYFRSGEGWYSATFAPEKDGSWCRIVIDKSMTGTEGTPQGWGAIDTMRLSAWRAADRDTTCAIANPAPVGSDARVLVVRADSCVSSNQAESQGYARYAEHVASCLEDAGIGYALLSDHDVTPERLAGRKLVLLPYNPRLPDGMLSRLRAFVADGGKVVSFYSLARGIPELLGLKRGAWISVEGGTYQGFVRTEHGLVGQPEFAGQASWSAQVAEPVPGVSKTVAVWRGADGKATQVPAIVVSEHGGHVSHVWLKDDWDHKKALMLALVGKLVPGVWETAAARSFAAIGRFGSYRDFASLEEDLRGMKGVGPEVLSRAAALRRRAKALMAEKKWVASIQLAEKAAAEALKAWCMSRPSQAGEHRAFWCHSAFGIPGKTWDEAVQQLADSGFNALLPNMCWGGTAFYPSEVLPIHPSVAEQGDQVAACLAACRKYGVACHIWKVNWNMSHHASGTWAASMRKAGRVQVQRDGTVQERWLCPSHPANRDLEVAAMVELARNYDVDGIHFDYIRYPGRSSCFCPGCRERFEQRLGQAVATWPDDCDPGGSREKAWLDFRRSNIDAVVQVVAKQAKKARPDVDISAAVFRNWPSDRDSVGQDWKRWCDEGWLDFVCPMDYTESNATFKNQVGAQLNYAGEVPVYPGIGLSCWKNPRDVVKLVEQIELTRQFNTGGFTVFQYDARMESVLPLMALGTTSVDPAKKKKAGDPSAH